MRLLTLVRHAKSSWDDPGQNDFDRPLNARGERVAPEMAERMAPLLEPPLRIVSSPALRALTTARVFAKALDLRPRDIVEEPRIYEATPGTLLDIVHGLDDAVAHVVLFGHNPGFSEFARLLTQASAFDMPTCAVATLGLDAPHWHDVAPGCGRMLRYRYPKELGL